MGSLPRSFPGEPRALSYHIERPELENECLEAARNCKHVVLVGPRGIGKTQLARTVARKLLRDANGRTIKEIDGSSEEQMKGLLQHLNETNNINQHSIVIIDGVSQSTQRILHQLEEQKPDDTTYIITTIDENLSSSSIKVPSFSREEFGELITKLNAKENKEIIPHDMKEDFFDALDSNPLDLYYTVQYLKSTKKSPVDWLDSLQKGDYFTLPNDKNCFKENEYSSSLAKALEGDLYEIFKNLNDRQGVVEALWTLAFYDNKDIPIEVFESVFNGNRSYNVVDTLLAQVQTYSLGSISRTNKDCRLLTLNKAFQRVLISKMEDPQQSLELVLKTMLHICHKDNRVSCDYKNLVHIEPHIKSVLNRKIARKSVGLSILEVWLLSALGHLYIQTEEVADGEESLRKAFKVIEKDFFNSKVKLLSLTEDDVDQLFQSSQTEEAQSAIKDFVQSLRISASDISKWSNREYCLNEHLGNRVFSLTPDLYEKLVENNCAYDVDTVVQYFIAELVATVLYTYGRIFLYNRKDKNGKKKALEICDMICQKIESSFEVKLLHSELVHRNGLLCYHLKTAENEIKEPNQIQEDAANAKNGYENILNESCDRFEFGLLKCVKNEQYQKMECERYKLKASSILYERANCTEEKARYESQILGSIKSLDKVMIDQGSNMGKLQRNTSKQTEIARALLLLTSDEHLQDARRRFADVCVTEKQCIKINYPWMEALEGLFKLAKIYKTRNHKMATEIAKQAKKAIRSYIARSGEFEGYYDNKEAAKRLSESVNDLISQLDQHRAHQNGNNVMDSVTLSSMFNQFSSDILVVDLSSTDA